MSFTRRSLPTLNAFRAFEVSGRHQNFRAASEELGVIQGAVAQQVRLLEDHLCMALFDRLPRGRALTDQGRAFDLLTTATDRLQNRAGVVTISVTPTLVIRMLIPQPFPLQWGFNG